MASTLKLATYNIRNTTDRYQERRSVLALELEKCFNSGVDVLGLQEVRFESESNEAGTFTDQSIQLTKDFPFMTVLKVVLESPFTKPGVDETFRIDGNVILCNTNTVDVISHASIVLSPSRSAHRVVFRRKQQVGGDDGDSITIEELYSLTNVHFHHEIGDEHALIRLEQTRATEKWCHDLNVSENITLSVIAGDFNASPEEAAYHYLTQECEYVSCYAAAHGGQEPSHTFYTGLIADTMDTDPPLTCDYIFARPYNPNNNSNSSSNGTPSIEVASAYLFGNVCSPNDSTLYPSDHYGIYATIAAAGAV